MTNLTRGQAKSYVRSKCKNLKSDSLTDNMLNVELDLAQSKVLNDTYDFGVSLYQKISYQSGYRFQLPTDIMPIPNALIDVLASTGEKASVTTAFTGTHNDMVFTARNPGTSQNGFVIRFVETSGIAQSPGILFYSSVNQIDITVEKTVTLASSVITAFNASPLVNDLFSVALASGNNGTGTIDYTGANNSNVLANGTGSGYVAADEWTITQDNRDDGYINTATATYPKFVIEGDPNGLRVLRFKPTTIVYSKLIYRFSIPNMSADTDSLSIPSLYQELVLLEVIAKAFKFLNMDMEFKNTVAEYQSKMQELAKKYQDSLAFKTQENNRVSHQDRD